VVGKRLFDGLAGGARLTLGELGVKLDRDLDLALEVPGDGLGNVLGIDVGQGDLDRDFPDALHFVLEIAQDLIDGSGAAALLREGDGDLGSALLPQLLVELGKSALDAPGDGARVDVKLYSDVVNRCHG
jgi:hypothetical protein